MDCLIHLAASLCLLSPSGLTLRADVSTQVAGAFTYHVDGRDYGGAHVGRIALDLPLVSYRGFTLVGGLEHTSLIDTPHDRGQERVTLGLLWRPFR